MAVHHPVGFLSKGDVRNLPLARTGQTISEDDEMWHDGWQMDMHDVRRMGLIDGTGRVTRRDSATSAKGRSFANPLTGRLDL